MAVILKPRSNKQGIVDTSADLANVEGRENYTVLVKDLGLFEWVATGTVDDLNIFAGKTGYWSRVLQSGEGTNLLFTPENSANKSISVTSDAASDTKYPSVKAAKTYADSLVVGLLNDRGNFTPSVSSPGSWPTTGGSGTAGAIKKGDLWFCAANGFLGTTAVVTGTSFRALSDAPGQTAGNWNILDAGLGYTPENVTNKSTSTSLGTSNTLYPTQNAVKTYVDNNAGLPYKVYTASVLLDGSGATVTVYKNTIGDGSADGVNDIAWSKDFFGWLVTMSGSTAFPAGKTWIQSSNYISGGQAFNFYGVRTSNTVLTYRSIRPSDNASAAGFAGSIFLEIRVYP
jgi:hypothetical protein